MDGEFKDAANLVGVTQSLRWWVGMVVVTSLIVEGDLMGGCSHQMDSSRKSGGWRGCCNLSTM
jgi:hypothetical protein